MTFFQKYTENANIPYSVYLGNKHFGPITKNEKPINNKLHENQISVISYSKNLMN